MEKIATVVVLILAVPLMLLNVFGALVSGAILLFGGDWVPIILGILFMMFGTLFISLLLIPSMLLGGIGVYFANRKNRIGVGLAFFASQWFTYAVIFGVSYSVFATMLQFEGQANRLALLVWSFSVAIAPWSFMASKEQDNSGTQSTLFLAQAGILAILLLIAFGGLNLDESYRIISSLIIFPVLFSTFYAIKMTHNSGETLLMEEYGNGTDKYSQNELIAFVVALLHIARSDGNLQVAETKHVKNSFKGITGERISKGFVERVYLALDTGAITVEDSIKNIKDFSSDDFKKLIILGCKDIAYSDKGIEPNEINAIKDIGDLLDLSKSEIVEILREKS